MRIIKTLIHEKKIDEDAILTFSGGEPTLLPQLKYLCVLFQSYSNSLAYNFLTNGVILSDPIMDLIKVGKKININVSLDSGSREGYFRIKGKDYFNQVISNIILYKKVSEKFSNKNLNISLKFIIIEENIDQIYLFIQLAKNLGFESVLYDLDFHVVQSVKIFDAIQRFNDFAKKEKIQCNFVGVGSR